MGSPYDKPPLGKGDYGGRGLKLTHRIFNIGDALRTYVFVVVSKVVRILNI